MLVKKMEQSLGVIPGAELVLDEVHKAFAIAQARSEREAARYVVSGKIGPRKVREIIVAKVEPGPGAPKEEARRAKRSSPRPEAHPQKTAHRNRRAAIILKT